MLQKENILKVILAKGKEINTYYGKKGEKRKVVFKIKCFHVKRCIHRTQTNAR